MRNSMLLTIYLCMSAAYIQANHYTLALQVLDDAEKASGKAGSQIYYRRSQAITSNLNSSLEDLEKAKEAIEQAIKIKPYEKLFSSQKGIQKILNIDNA